IASARSGRTGPTEATVYDAKGKEVKTVSLSPRPPYNYAAAVAEGRPAIAPVHAKALLIPVPTAPSGEGYLLAGGQVFIMRKRAADIHIPGDDGLDRRSHVRSDLDDDDGTHAVPVQICRRYASRLGRQRNAGEVPRPGRARGDRLCDGRSGRRSDDRH